MENGKRRWVPDAWTMQERGLSPSSLLIVDNDEMEGIPLGPSLPSTLPPPSLQEGAIVESESGVFQMEGGRLQRVLDPRELALSHGFDRESVAFLPDAIIRGLFADGAPSDMPESTRQ
ncbi:hypothetical protein [Phytohabitans houttuyneae]|uniref:hypothetical protein n=1 Tax=Phytohabitans houttuyneae TaxID=1076126 RepID=UPI0031EE4EBC